jgi:nitroimidazol reductase NimA-like FMN-containing flavoprotein (pyridoxamine 5'-phosphate oxidase superfamily)
MISLGASGFPPTLHERVPWTFPERYDRRMEELTRDAIDALLDEQVVGRLGCHDAGVTYVVPLIYVRKDDALYILTTEGKKVHTCRANPSVCFEVDEHDRTTGNWRSVIIQGRYEELDAAGTAEALALLGKRFGGRRPPASGPAQAAARPTVAFRVRIQSATGRAK